MGGEAPGFELMGSVMRRVTEVIGPGAAYSMFHYAAVQEGQRLASGAQDLLGALGRIDAALGVRTSLVEDEGGRIVLRIAPEIPAAFTDRGVQGLFLGLLEGAISAGRRRVFHTTQKGDLHLNGGELLLEFGSGAT